jgi:uncharacterized protein (TIGR04255 family)
METKLNNSPIEEVTCEFRLQEALDDLTLYGNFYNLIQSNFPKKKKITGRDVILDKSGSEVQPKLIEYNLQQFLTDDEKTYIQIGPEILSIHKLKPYGSWIEFYKIIEDTLGSYYNIFGDKHFNHVEISYLNHIIFDETILNLDEYFLFRPQVNEELGPTSGPFIVGAHFLRDEQKDLLRISSSGARPDKKDRISIQLEINYITHALIDKNAKSILEWTGKAHDEIIKAFFLCITDKLMARLK